MNGLNFKNNFGDENDGVIEVVWFKKWGRFTFRLILHLHCYVKRKVFSLFHVEFEIKK